MLRCSSRVAAGVFVLAGMLCVPAVAGARVVADASGRRVAVADTSRVLAIGGDGTEIL